MKQEDFEDAVLETICDLIHYDCWEGDGPKNPTALLRKYGAPDYEIRPKDYWFATTKRGIRELVYETQGSYRIDEARPMLRKALACVPGMNVGDKLRVVIQDRSCQVKPIRFTYVWK
jgi:hypothetical protein